MEVIKKEEEFLNIIKTNSIYQKLSPEAKSTLNEIQNAIKEAESCVVFDVEGINDGSKYLRQIKTISTKFEELRQKTVKPYNDRVKEINGFFTEIKSLLGNISDRLNKEIMDVKRIQDEKKKEEAAAEQARILEEIRVQKEEEEKKLKNIESKNNLENEVIKDKIEELIVIPEVVVKSFNLNNSNEYGIKTTKIAKWKLIDINLVPKEYLCLDESKVTKFRKECGTDPDKYKQYEIPGIEFYHEEKTRL